MATREEVRRRLAEYIADHPRVSISQIAARVGVAESTCYAVMREYGVSRRRKLTAESLARLDNKQLFALHADADNVVTVDGAAEEALLARTEHDAAADRAPLTGTPNLSLCARMILRWVSRCEGGYFWLWADLLPAMRPFFSPAAVMVARRELVKHGLLEQSWELDTKVGNKSEEPGFAFTSAGFAAVRSAFGEDRDDEDDADTLVWNAAANHGEVSRG